MSLGRRTRLLALLGAVLASTRTSSAQERGVGRASNRDQLLAELTSAERAFARDAMITGQRSAWLSWFAPEGVMFRTGGFVKAQDFMRRPPQETQAAPPGAFDWRPAYGDVSADGDYGYSSGPVKITQVGRSDRYFFSFWIRQRDGTWRVVVDLGTNVLFPERDPFDDPYVPARQPAPYRFGPAGVGLNDIERDSLGGPSGVDRWIDQDIRALRSSRPLVIGETSYRRTAADDWRNARFTTEGWGVSRSQDLGYTFGRYFGGPAGTARGVYARAWRRDNLGKWRIAFDVARPDSTAPDTGGQEQGLPRAADLVARYVAATGADKWKDHKSARMRATMEIVELGATAGFEMRLLFPGKTYTGADIPSIGLMASGFDGEHAWQMNPLTGDRLLTGTALEAAKLESDAGAQFTRASLQLVSSETIERTVMNEQPCFRVRHTWASGRTSYDCFSVADGLIVATVQMVNTPMGEVEITANLSDYADVGGGFRRARLVSQSMPESSQVIRLVSWVWDDVTEAEVALPPAIRALVPAKPPEPRE